MGHTAQVPPVWVYPVLQGEEGRACFSALLSFGTWLTLDKCCLQTSGILKKGFPRHALGSHRVSI